MSMVINLVEDHNIYLCEGGPVYNGGVQPTPITYLTQWKLMGNSVVHTDEYLTQWKVEGNSVVDNNTILSCGDLGQDGKYHVKISNGVTIYDIALDEPLRKVNDVADTIEFVNGSAVLTRNLKEVGMATLNWRRFSSGVSDIYRYIAQVEDAYSYAASEFIKTINTGGYKNVRGNDTYYHQEEQRIIGMYEVSARFTYPAFAIYDPNYNQADDLSALLTYLSDKRIIYRLATPTTEVIEVSPFPVSPTDTYTSANDTPYSAFEYKKNVEIWSCGEYSAVDGKYHILVQPLGGSIADITLDEPLRKYNNAVDSIEYDDSVATLTREVEEIDGQLNILDTPTTETIQVPQIEEADSYSCVISQGAKAVEWSDFETE